MTFGIAVLVFRLLSDSTHLLGDGGRAIMDATPPRRYHLSEMVPGVLNALAAYSFAPLGWSARAVLEWLSCVWGGLFVVTTTKAAGHLSLPSDRFLFAGVLLTSGVIQFGFGYVESYPLLHLLILCYLVIGWMTLQAESMGRGEAIRRSLLANALITLTVGAHLSALSLVPAHAYLVKRIADRVGYRVLIAHFAAAILLVGSVIIAIAQLMDLSVGHLAIGSSALPWRGGYSLLSSRHMLDVLNEVILVIPAVLPLALYAGWRPPAGIGSSWHAGTTFLLVATAGSACFAFGINPILGMARDWDLISIFWLPSTLLLLLGVLRTRTVSWRSAMLIITSSLCLTSPWIAVNHNRDAALARFRDLLEMDHDRPGTPYGYEIVGTHLRYQGNHKAAVDAFKKALELRASSKRLQGQLEHASLLLARQHIGRGEYEDAVMVLEDISDGNAVSAERHLLMGVAVLGQGQCTLAIQELERAIELGWTADNVSVHLGFAFRKCGKNDEALRMFRVYLDQYPNGAYSDVVRRILSEQIEAEEH